VPVPAQGSRRLGPPLRDRKNSSLPLLVVTAVVVLVLNISPFSCRRTATSTRRTGIRRSSSGRRRRRRWVFVAALVAGGFVVVIMLFGWLLTGNAELEGGAATLPASGSAGGARALVEQRRFDPSQADAQTGIARSRSTTTAVSTPPEDGKTLFETLHATNAGDSVSGRAFFGEAGDYVSTAPSPATARPA
jgi:hypothetical protein